MKKILLTGLFLGMGTHCALAQSKFENQVKEISQNIEKIRKTEQEALRIKIEKINYDLDKNLITPEKSAEEKKAAQDFHSKNIEEKVNLESEKLNQYLQDKANGLYGDENNPEIVDEKAEKKEKRKAKAEEKERKDSRVNLSIYGSFGFNQTSNNSLWMKASHHYMGGLAFNYRLTDSTPRTFLKTGIELNYTNLRQDKNLVLSKNNDITSLVKADKELEESRLRMVSIEIPIYYVIDFSQPISKKNKAGDEYTYHPTHKSWRSGLGGFIGINTNVSQRTGYMQDNAEHSIRENSAFNTSNFVYGLNAFVGYNNFSIYAKYHLNPLFQSPNAVQNVWTLGLGIGL
jgi:hypothetical protein